MNNKAHRQLLCLLIVTAVIVGACPSASVRSSPQASTIHTTDWTFSPTTSHYYKVITTCSGWNSCQAAAVSEGGHLVTINDADEQAWLVVNFGGAGLYWIGFTDANHEGDWQWISGETSSYVNWASGEPSNSGNAEHYALMNWVTPGLWNDGHEAAVTSGAIVERTDSPHKVYLPLVAR